MTNHNLLEVLYYWRDQKQSHRKCYPNNQYKPVSKAMAEWEIRG